MVVWCGNGLLGDDVQDTDVVVDFAVLHRGIFFDHGVVGKAIKGPICTHQFSGGVSMVSIEQEKRGWGVGYGMSKC